MEMPIILSIGSFCMMNGKKGEEARQYEWEWHLYEKAGN